MHRIDRMDHPVEHGGRGRTNIGFAPKLVENERLPKKNHVPSVLYRQRGDS